MFVGLHVMLANASDQPWWAISPEEGDSFMKAAQNVMKHYSVEASQKTIDWIAFGGVCCGMYLPRIAITMAEQRRRHNGEPPLDDRPPPQRDHRTADEMMAQNFEHDTIKPN